MLTLRTPKESFGGLYLTGGWIGLSVEVVFQSDRALSPAQKHACSWQCWLKETSLVVFFLLRAAAHTGNSPKGIYLFFCFLSEITALMITVYFFIQV